jgi:hypothetical protein
MGLRQTNAYLYRCDHEGCAVCTPLVNFDQPPEFDDEAWLENLTVVGGWRFIPGERLVDWIALCPAHAHEEPPATPDPDPDRHMWAADREDRAREHLGRARPRNLSRPSPTRP